MRRFPIFDMSGEKETRIGQGQSLHRWETAARWALRYGFRCKKRTLFFKGKHVRLTWWEVMRGKS